jgi:hypothetical protein
MNDRDVLHIFEELTDCASTAELVAFVFAHPVVLSLEWQTRFADFAKDLPEKKLAKIAHALQSVDLMTRSLDQDLSKYQIGPGPVEKVYARIRNGEITEARGVEIAAQPGIYGLLSLIYVRRLSIDAEAMARSDDWKSGLLIQTLVLATLDARRSQLWIDQEAMDFCAAVHWLDIVTRAVWDVPDGSLFRDAVARGEAFASTIQDPGGFYQPGEMLYRLGVLHLDPYVWQRNLTDYQQQWRVWQDRLTQLWAAGYEGSKDDAARVPPVREALHKAA